LYGCETLLLLWKKKGGLRVLKKIACRASEFVPSPNKIRVIKSSRMRCAGYPVFRKFEGKRQA
jgi:hypothetical protein